MQEIMGTIMAEAYTEWRNAPHNLKGFTIQKYAGAMNISAQTLHRKLKTFAHQMPQKKEKTTKGVAKIPHLHDYAKTIAHMYAFLPRGCRRPPLEPVIEKALINGLLPPEAAQIPSGTFARVLRELRLLDEDGRVLRFEAARPMEQVQYDVSGSEYLYVHRIEKSGEPILRVRSRKNYKNKDKFENLRVWYHGMVDDCSRYWLAMPFVSPGESSVDALQFCRWAFSKKDDDRIIFRGLPGRVYMDNGPLARAQMTVEFFDRIGVDIKTHEPNSPEDTGKIEVKWKSLWSSFESLEFLMDPNFEGREYTLSDLQERLINYTVRLNRKKHPNQAGTREEIWQKVLYDGGVIDIEESAFDTAFKRYKRHVEPDGTFSLDNNIYSVKGLYDAWVWVYQGLTSGQMAAEDTQTHKRYTVAAFATPALDEIKKDKTLPGARIREEAKEYKKEYKTKRFKGIYENRENNGDGRITMFPVKTKDIRHVEDPFDVSVYPSLREAREEFFETVGAYVSSEDWRDISALIAENGLKKQYVLDLALEIRGEMERQKQNNGGV